ncbi:PAS domain-containing sensor histidine kinase [Hyalangium sp.]|uniref:PAS domain-containing sensor histidine kinase n=1 Tax=Hyalangium sp. TaxID=2028555 RepID=UPI002D4A94F0|nr:ATP-binding protein [Hyalangium sp.]HYH96126.1 ATP-binding protein [Hyalangium sp.]
MNEALRASERRYRSLVEALTQTVWTLNPRGELAEPALGWREFTGQSEEEHLGLGWLEAIHPEDRPRMMAEWTRALRQRAPYRQEVRLQHQDETYRDVILCCVPVLQDDGSVLEWIGMATDISPRKLAERALRQATQARQRVEERYRTFVNQSTEGIWRMELLPPISVHLPEEEQLEAMFRTAYLAECNSAMARMHGLEHPSALVGRRLDQFLARTRPRDTEYLRAFIRGGYRLENSETQEVGPNDTLKVFLSNLVGVVEDGHLVRAWGTQREVTEQCLARLALETRQEEAQRSAQQLRTITDALPAHDITDRKQAETEVEAQRARLYDILMNSPASIAILSGPRQIFSLVNPVYQQMAMKRELLGVSLLEALSGPDSHAYSELVRRVYETGKPFSLQEARFRVHLPGEVEEDRILNMLLHPLRDSQGQVDSVMSFAIDVTEHLGARQKLEEWAAHLAHQEQWLRSVLDVMPVALLLLEPVTGRVSFANQAAHRMAGGSFPLGVPAQEYDRSYRITYEDGTPMPNDQVPAARAARGERIQGESLVWHTSVGSYNLLIDSEMTPAAHGHPATVLLTLQDVSQLKQTQSELQEAVRLRDEFLTVASHELRTPLTPLQLKLQALIRDCAADLSLEELRERTRRTAERATHQVHKLVELISDLLDVSRLSEGKLSLLLEPVDLSELVREVAGRLALEARRAQCPLIIQAPEAVVGTWDSLRIEQAVSNLLSNALKYGPGKPVTLRVEQRGCRARLTVSDEGIGIAPEDLKRIFEKFERAVSPRHYGGLGLGLYITRELLQALGGTIQVESEPEQGTTFTVELPLHGVHPSPDPAASAPSPAQGA